MRGGLVAIQVAKLPSRTKLSRKKRPLSYRDSWYSSSAHLQLHTCHLSHAYIQCVHSWCSRMTWHSVNFTCYLPTCCSLRLKSRFALVVRRTTSTQHTGGTSSRRTRWSALARGAEPWACSARERPRGRTWRTPNTNQRGRRRSTRQPGLHHVKSLKFTVVGYSSSSACSYSPPVPPPMANSRRPTQLRSRHVRIAVFSSAIVIDVIVHCHTAGALLSQTAEQLSLASCGWVLIRSGQFKITLVAELGIQPTETSAIAFSTFSIAVTVFLRPLTVATGA